MSNLAVPLLFMGLYLLLFSLWCIYCYKVEIKTSIRCWWLRLTLPNSYVKKMWFSDDLNPELGKAYSFGTTTIVYIGRSKFIVEPNQAPVVSFEDSQYFELP